MSKTCLEYFIALLLIQLFPCSGIINKSNFKPLSSSFRVCKIYYEFFHWNLQPSSGKKILHILCKSKLGTNLEDSISVSFHLWAAKYHTSVYFFNFWKGEIFLSQFYIFWGLNACWKIYHAIILHMVFAKLCSSLKSHASLLRFSPSKSTFWEKFLRKSKKFEILMDLNRNFDESQIKGTNFNNEFFPNHASKKYETNYYKQMILSTFERCFHKIF